MPDTKDEEREEEVSSPADSWAEAFAAVEREADDGASASNGEEQSTDDDNTEHNEEPSTDSTTEPAGESEDVATQDGGGSVSDQPEANSDNVWGEIPIGEEPETTEVEFSGYTEETAKQYLKELDRAQEEQASNDIFEALKKGNVHVAPNGKLGYTLDDPAIFQRDEEGMPVFVNPDTGREFSGDDPRAQATQWINTFNNELKSIVNNEVQKRKQQLYEATLPTRRMIEFDPTYSKLDPVRQSLFDSMIEDYEVYDDSGTVIGYSCDLNKTLQAVNRQIRKLKNFGVTKDSDTAQNANKPVTKPATDMKTSGTPKGKEQTPKFNSVADALGYLQDQEISERKKK